MRYLVAVSMVLLAGCGQAGDLYLPPEPPAPPPSTAPAEAPPVPVPEEKKDKP